MSGAQQVYAVIKPRSKYAYQQPRAGKDALPFPVSFAAHAERGDYGVYGNANVYRVSDLRFYVRVDGSAGSPLVRIA